MIQAAIVGCGNIAHSHVEGLLAFPDRCGIAALCDIYPEKAEKMKQKYGLDCPVFDDHEKMLASGLKIDLVHVCTPPYVHAQIAIHAMDAGMNTVVEKPMATCLEECDAMVHFHISGDMSACYQNACIAAQEVGNVYPVDSRSLSTGIGQLVTLAFYLVIYRLRPVSVHITRKGLHGTRGITARLYAVGIPAALNLALPSLLISCLSSVRRMWSCSASITNCRLSCICLRAALFRVCVR